jgi:hypothetical protein
MSVRWTKRFWIVSFDFILFLDILKFFVYMHLTISFAVTQIS